MTNIYLDTISAFRFKYGSLYLYPNDSMSEIEIPIEEIEYARISSDKYDGNIVSIQCKHQEVIFDLDNEWQPYREVFESLVADLKTNGLWRYE